MGGTETPLHVRVAEALGIDTQREHEWDEARDGRKGCVLCGALSDWDGKNDPPMCVLRYDTDWSATGTLIERFGLDLLHRPNLPFPAPWEAHKLWTGSGLKDVRRFEADGRTPLVAVCNLILALRAAGKLPA